jgi:hypothetical protein
MRAWLLSWLVLPFAAFAGEAEQRARVDLIDSIVAGFPAQVEGQADVYFVGFAGVGEERVFAEEIKLAARVVGDKYGATERSLLLINDRRDLASQPPATGIGLRHALNAIGRVMNPDEDIVFLVLSSHGSRDGMIEMSNTGLLPRGLAAEDLGQVLRESGIRWQVVVVSACFSGAFVEPLAHEDSIVITAAARDRASFGCSDQRNLTYFGEAFFRDALAAAPTLREAAESARKAIRRREKIEKMRASHPQAHFGAALEEKLR